ncbi:MAG: hypothetical protein ACLQDY_10730 [Streptosporangiaceae bacterium]
MAVEHDTGAPDPADPGAVSPARLAALASLVRPAGQRPGGGQEAGPDSAAPAAGRRPEPASPVSPGDPGAAGIGEPAGDARVGHALAELRELASTPVAGHPAIFERVHQRLRDVLGELDHRPAAGAQQGRRPS